MCRMCILLVLWKLCVLCVSVLLFTDAMEEQVRWIGVTALGPLE